MSNAQPDKLFLYRGKSVDELSADEMRDALKMCIHDLEQERKYNQPSKPLVVAAKTSLHEKVDIAAKEMGRIMKQSTQNTANKSDYEKTDEQGRPLTYWGGLKDDSSKTPEGK